MKHLGMLLASLLVLLTGLTALPVGTEAATGQAGDLVTVNREQTIRDDYYAAGETVKITGTVSGDVVAAGSDVVIEGRVTGNVWAVGSAVTVSGTVGGSVRAAGETVNVSGRVGRDVIAFGSEVGLDGRARVGGDLITFAQRTALGAKSRVGGEVRSSGDDLTVNGSVGGAVDANLGGELVLGRTARVAGVIKYEAPEQLTRQRGARVGGTIDFTKGTQDTGESVADQINGQIYWFLASVLLLLGVLLYARRAAVRAAGLLRERPGMSLLAGGAFLVLTPIIAVILLLSIVGLPLSLITLLGYVLVLYSSKVFVSLAVGGLVMRGSLPDRFWPVFGVGTLGLAAYYLLAIVPVVGPILMFTVTVLGAGMQLLLFKEVYNANRKQYGA